MVLFPVKGSVSYKKKTVPQVVVTFHPDDGAGNSVQTVVNDDGEFSLECPKGKYKVTISSLILPDDPKAAPTRFEQLLTVYGNVDTTPLSVEVPVKEGEDLKLEIR